METLKTGTTTLGIMVKDGVILAADKRATAGNFIANKEIRKIIEINEEMALTVAGTVSDVQLIAKLLKAELKLKEIKTGRKNTVREAANLLAGMVYHNIRKFSVIPGISHFLFAGTDQFGVTMYEIYPDGSINEVKDFVSSGSGSVMAYGVLETTYKKGLGLKEGEELAMQGMKAALSRDSASGNGYDMILITPKGIQQLVSKHIPSFS